MSGIAYGSSDHPIRDLLYTCETLSLDSVVAMSLPEVGCTEPGDEDRYANRPRPRLPEMPRQQRKWEDELSRRIGYICQADVRLELQVRFLYQGLAGGNQPLSSPGMLSPLLKECRTILERGDPPSAESTKTLAAIDLAVSAHEKRNRVVHDLWLPTQSGYDSLSAVRIDVASMLAASWAAAQQLSFEDLEEVRVELDEAARVVAHLTMNFGMIPVGKAPQRAPSVDVNPTEHGRRIGRDSGVVGRRTKAPSRSASSTRIHRPPFSSGLTFARDVPVLF